MQRGIGISTFIVVVTLILTTTATAAPEDTFCGPSMYSGTAGMGGAEICGLPYPCGVSDGVCPSNFSEGQNESDPVKKQMMLRIMNPPTPADDDQVVSFETGNAACQRIGGTCTGVEEATNRSGPWTSSPTISCSDSVNTTNKYLRAQCDPVPQVAGCENCPDPDCTAELTGTVTKTSDGSPLENAYVRITNDNHGALDTSLSFPPTDANGTYTYEGLHGYFNITCTKAGYTPVTAENVYLQPGKNTFDCNMDVGACRSDCTLPNSQGEYVCDPICAGVNGCTYPDNKTMNACNALSPGAEPVLGRINDTHVLVAQCCGDPPVERFSPVSSVNADIDTLEIIDYRKELDGRPVKLRVIVYEEQDASQQR